MFGLKIFAMAILGLSVLGCAVNQKVSAKTFYVWHEVTRQAEFPQGYNYPVFVLKGEMLALNNGGWISKDGKNWTKTGLPESGLNSAYQKFVQFNGAVYALGAMRGNYLDFSISTKITRTRDGKTWETVAEKSNLPERIFYGAVAFKDKIWLVGGFDGKRYYNDVWSSPDAVSWTRVAEKTGWSERNVSGITVFKDRLFLIGGGVIDGEADPNPNSRNEIWSSPDGVNWTKNSSQISKESSYVGGSIAVFDGKIWLVGVNRNNEFESGVLYSPDGADWRKMNAPWSPRGAVAVWVFENKLFMTGGKSSYVENGETKFVYSNDVWAMSRKTE